MKSIFQFVRLSALTTLGFVFLISTHAEAGKNDWMYVCSGRDNLGDQIQLNSTRINDENDVRILSYQNRSRVKPGFGTPQDPFVSLSGRYYVKPNSLTHQYSSYDAGKRFTISVQFLSSPLTWLDDELPKKPNAALTFTIQSGLREDSEIEKQTKADLFCYTRKGGE